MKDHLINLVTVGWDWRTRTTPLAKIVPWRYPKAFLSHYSTGVHEGLLRLMSTALVITVEHLKEMYYLA